MHAKINSDTVLTEYAFIGGVGALGIFSLVAGFISSKTVLFILRALSGVAGAMSIPSAISLLIRIFPNPTERSCAIGVFGGSGAAGTGEHS